MLDLCNPHYKKFSHSTNKLLKANGQFDHIKNIQKILLSILQMKLYTRKKKKNDRKIHT